jgi:CheY-like chemotaxis protein
MVLQIICGAVGQRLRTGSGAAAGKRSSITRSPYLIRKLETGDGVLSTNGVKILMVTTIDDAKEVVGSFHALCDAYLVKPIDKSRLLEEIRRMV